MPSDHQIDTLRLEKPRDVVNQWRLTAPVIVSLHIQTSQEDTSIDNLICDMARIDVQLIYDMYVEPYI